MATDESAFPSVHYIEPLAKNTHTHTAIIIHGRGSSSSEFAEEVFCMKLLTRCKQPPLQILRLALDISLIAITFEFGISGGDSGVV